MKPSPLQRNLVMYSASLGSQILVLLFTNQVDVLSYEISGFPTEHPSPFPAQGQITVHFNDKAYILKWILINDASMLSYQIQAIIFDPSNPPPAIIGSNGQNISRLRSEIQRTIAISLDSQDAKETAIGMATWLFQEIGKIDKEIK